VPAPLRGLDNRAGASVERNYQVASRTDVDAVKTQIRREGESTPVPLAHPDLTPMTAGQISRTLNVHAQSRPSVEVAVALNDPPVALSAHGQRRGTPHGFREMLHGWPRLTATATSREEAGDRDRCQPGA